MPGATPKYQLPYPVGTDRVADGDNAIQALAERVEAVMVGGPYVVKVGRQSVAFNASGDCDIVFPTAFPTGLVYSHIDLVDSLNDIGALMFRNNFSWTGPASMSWRVFTPNGAVFPNATLTIMWVAIGY